MCHFQKVTHLKLVNLRDKVVRPHAALLVLALVLLQLEHALTLRVQLPRQLLLQLRRFGQSNFLMLLLLLLPPCQFLLQLRQFGLRGLLLLLLLLEHLSKFHVWSRYCYCLILSKHR